MWLFCKGRTKYVELEGGTLQAALDAARTRGWKPQGTRFFSPAGEVRFDATAAQSFADALAGIPGDEIAGASALIELGRAGAFNMQAEGQAYKTRRENLRKFWMGWKRGQ